MKTWYEGFVQKRGRWQYYRGLLSRFISHCKYKYIIRVAKRNGACIGKYVTISKRLAKNLNSNCIIGDHVSINTDAIDVRASLCIGNNVIIGSGSKIITVSHNIDSPDWEPKYYGLVIEDYVWIANNAIILPSCRKIGRGAVIGAGSVVVRDVEPMSVVSGNPANEIRKRKTVHKDLPVERLLHGDYIVYKETYARRNEVTVDKI